MGRRIPLSRLTVLVPIFLLGLSMAGCGQTEATPPTAATTKSAELPLTAARAKRIATAGMWAEVRRLGPSVDHGAVVEVRCDPETERQAADNAGEDIATLEKLHHVSSRDVFFECLLVHEDGRPAWLDRAVRPDGTYVDDLH